MATTGIGRNVKQGITIVRDDLRGIRRIYDNSLGRPNFEPNTFSSVAIEKIN
jgi:hypothetical protein